jgi:hypothetical protein
MKPENICLSTVPPTAPPAPCVYLDLPYAVALRDYMDRYKMRAQMNTKYMEASAREATVTHVLNMLISKLTRADIQSTITPDEGRNVPWHIYNIEACDTAKQTLVGLDGSGGAEERRPPAGPGQRNQGKSLPLYGRDRGRRRIFQSCRGRLLRGQRQVS